ncbi:MAG TPA: PepSY-like domain-containing protein [Flavilitoribacter sp.]|nr:PepSY-like domain-containing protein [Flavilitoribacter sp.]HMQ86478.1 PepSY-like domain-containing protein [Flavilitoribacter sp.]
MKYLTLVACFCLGLLSTSCAQKTSAPDAVNNAFKARFPTVQKVKWDKEAENEWEGEFRMNGKEMSANFNADGAWLETETEIKKSGLPQAVKDAIAAQFAGYKVEEAALVETPDMASAYEVELEKGETTIEALFKGDGTLIKQKTESEDDED